MSKNMKFGHAIPCINLKVPRKCTVAKQDMCFYCFEVLYRHLHGLTLPNAPFFANGQYPIFVTWEIGRDRRLRGCLGTFSPVELESGLRTYAVKSALNDTRFSPISRGELKRLHVSVSVLLHFEDGQDYTDWTVGVHGIRIEFEDGKGNMKSATFLPEVAAERGWDTTETIDQLLRKGGFRGPITTQVRESIRLTRYKTEKIRASYQDFTSHSRGRSKTHK
ncbi:hypothetical protein GE061_007475 [Apolygus lucorum]|uniref:AMMECR1 domain-containing protein n=1 Tax=Apolygus lucorum TaxID=248454 RepID=A0A8S9WTD3_APOLU|nr:hypothetical protein GE061_007475 [Apolygus lucorum]